MKKLTPEERIKYNTLRKDFDRRQEPNLKSCCNGPFNNMYFCSSYILK